MSGHDLNTQDFERLRAIGLTQAMLQRIALLEPPPPGSIDAQPMRVSEVQRDALTLHDGLDEHPARVRPALLGALSAEGDMLAVGDWVLAALATQGSPRGDWWVHARAAPLTRIARRTHDGRGGVVRQVIACNVDTALIVMGLDHDFNLRRLERYLALARIAGLGVLVVLTKADGCAEAGARLVQVGERLRPLEDAIAVDAREPRVRAAFEPWLGAGQTLALIGSSGAGKSTLTNTLLGRVVQDTGAVRDDDSRGRHTTTWRSLHRCAGGACIIDTPGLRTLRLDADADEIGATFDDVEALAAHCRFRDCLHQHEPGCAVRAGVSPERLASFHKLRREARRDSLTLLEKRQQLATWKMRARAAAARSRDKRG